MLLKMIHLHLKKMLQGMNNFKRSLSIKLNLSYPEIKHFVIKLTSNRKNAPLKCKINRSIMLKRSHRARTDPRKEAYVSVYYKAQMLPQDRFHNCFPHTNEDPTLAEQDKNKSDTNFLFFFEIRIVLHSGE